MQGYHAGAHAVQSGPTCAGGRNQRMLGVFKALGYTKSRRPHSAEGGCGQASAENKAFAQKAAQLPHTTRKPGRLFVQTAQAFVEFV